MTVPQINVGAFQATSGFSADDGRLTDGVTTTGSGWEQSSTSGATAQITSLYDLGASPPSQAQAAFTCAWQNVVNIILDTSNDMATWTTRASVTTPDHGGTYSAAGFVFNFSPSVTARYWRLSVQDTPPSGGAIG